MSAQPIVSRIVFPFDVFLEVRFVSYVNFNPLAGFRRNLVRFVQKCGFY
jgi:hypothetical protein